MVKSTNHSQQPNQKLGMEESPDPPFEETYKKLFDDIRIAKASTINYHNLFVVEECELPLIDLELLNGREFEREECKRKIAKASQEWGFFQVVNHGISDDILAKMRMEQIKLFKKPFNEKMNEKNHKFPKGSYRWGTPSATCLQQLSWSEAFHVPLTDISNSSDLSSLSSTMEQFATTLSELAHKLARILSEKMGCKSKYFRETCLPNTCYLRMNRYPACPISPQVFGLMPHTDSDFLTILHQDEIGGLQLIRDGKWISVKPNPQALIINIGDLFQFQGSQNSPIGTFVTTQKLDEERFAKRWSEKLKILSSFTDQNFSFVLFLIPTHLKSANGWFWRSTTYTSFSNPRGM